ncbi:MAG: thioredoxin-like domain-containing protein [Pirellulales bacterium]
MRRMLGDQMRGGRMPGGRWGIAAVAIAAIVILLVAGNNRAQELLRERASGSGPAAADQFAGAPSLTELADELSLAGPTDGEREDALPESFAADSTEPGEVECQPAKAKGGRKHPFPNARPAPEFPRDSAWLNVAKPVRLKDLRGKFVLLDFWTYCCINCMHILPELKKLERAYPNELVVIGVHSAKFEGEKDTKNIEEAILRYEIEHPVVNDFDHQIWDTFSVSSWPTIWLIDPEGNAVGQQSGEFKFELVDAVLKQALPYYRENKTLDPTPLRFELLSYSQPETPLRYPGKVVAHEPSQRLFIADSNHNRIIVTQFDGKLLEIIGSGEIGRANGDYASASFDHPQGMTLHGDTLYVADTENHMLRKIDLQAKKVSHVAGTGEQGSGWPGLDRAQTTGKAPERWVGPCRSTPLNSPWDLWIHEQHLYIAMAGPHQIWRMPLNESEIGPYAGNGREDIVDGPLISKLPYQPGASSFAQPSGLSSDGEWLFVADSEGSSIRAVPFDPHKEVRTVVGTSELSGGRLFHFGDVDGARDRVRLQHCLGVAYHDGKIYVADTYNNKIKVVDARNGATHTLVGNGEPGASDDPPRFDEPAGISYAAGKLYVADTNSHAIRVVDIATKKVTTLTIAGLGPPQPPPPKKPSFAGAKQVKVPPVAVQAENGAVQVQVKLTLPAGWKINPLAKLQPWIEATGDAGPVDRGQLGRQSIDKPATEFTLRVPVKGTGDDTVKVSFSYYYCQEGNEGLCKAGAVVFTVPLKVGTEGKSTVTLEHKVD